MTAPKRIAVLASGGGSNLGAMLEYFDSLGTATPATVALVASHRESAGALARATARGISTSVIRNPANAAEMLQLLDDHAIDVVALAGYLKLVPRDVTERYAGRIVNIHPALLPKHGGAGMYGVRVHRAVLDAGDTESGATVHLVDAEYDRGAVIARACVPVESADTAESLAARVLVAEHFVYPRALHLLIVPGTTPTYLANPPSGVTIDAPRAPFSL